MSTDRAAPLPFKRSSKIQRTVSTNVKVLMAVRDVGQQEIGNAIGKSDAAVGHKLNGRAKWSIDELDALATYSGWDIARFLDDPNGGAPGGIRTPKPSDPKIVPLYPVAA